jgi:hypothetical protein
MVRPVREKAGSSDVYQRDISKPLTISAIANLLTPTAKTTPTLTSIRRG